MGTISLTDLDKGDTAERPTLWSCSIPEAWKVNPQMLRLRQNHLLVGVQNTADLLCGLQSSTAGVAPDRDLASPEAPQPHTSFPPGSLMD